MLKHQPFTAMAQGHTDYNVDVIAIDSRNYGMLMTICATEEAVYITKEQAMAFFDLVPANRKIHIKCETTDGQVTGTTSLNVIRVEDNDDGSLTAVTDHWPR